MSLRHPFASRNQRVNQHAGKSLGKIRLFTSRDDAKSQKGGLGNKVTRDAFTKESSMTINKAISVAFAMTALVLPSVAFAHDGELFTNEISSLEALFTGGYMRIGLLGVCGVTAMMGAIKQNGFMFLTGILAGVFAFFMRNWIQTTFTAII